MEACYSPHYWGRTFESMGHNLGLMPAQHIIRFVSIKTMAQQEVLILHHLRERLLGTPIATSN